MTTKQKAWSWCSKYIRLRDSVEYCVKFGIDIGQFIRVEDIIGPCCTCGIIKPWIRMDAGHWKDRGFGGGSGVYFDERNINLQCKPCNGGLYQGTKKPNVKLAYDNFMLERHGQIVMDTLEFLHKNQSYKGKIVAIGEMYKQMYKELL